MVYVTKVRLRHSDWPIVFKFRLETRTPQPGSNFYTRIICTTVYVTKVQWRNNDHHFFRQKGFLYPSHSHITYNIGQHQHQTTKSLRKESKKNMSLFLPPNVQPLEPASSMQNWNDQLSSELENADFFKSPKGMENRSVQLNYNQL